MIVLPIAERELLVAARSRRTYWSRALAAIVVIFIALVIFDGYQRFGRSKVGGQQVFSALAYLALAYSLFAGAALTADCLSSEKRDETLGFLFLTDLKGHDIVLGKLLATSLRSIYGLLATFPVMSIPLLLGGVQAAEFWRVTLVILNTLLLSLSMGLLISTMFRRQRVTTHLAAILMLLLALVPLGMSALLKEIGGTTTLLLDPIAISPVYSLLIAFDSAYKLARIVGASFWTALLAQLGLAIVLLARASWLLPRSWQQTASQVRIASAATRTRENHRERIQMQRRRMLDRNPFYWLAGRGWGMTAGMTTVIGVIAALAVFARGDRGDFEAVRGVGILLVGLVSRLLIAVLAAQRLAEDKQNGALDLIITTPITVGALLAGQWRALWKKLGWPLLGSLVLYWFLIFGSQPAGSGTAEEDKALLCIAACLLVLTIADSVTLGWLGMWTGLRIRQVPHGAALCLCKVILPPAVVVAGLVWSHGLTSADEYIKANPYLVPCVWLGFGLATDLTWSLWARHKLLKQFRLAATDRFQRSDDTPRQGWRTVLARI